MNSTFYADGYQDAINGRKPNPPDPYTTGGGATNVLASEYMHGYADGRLDDAWGQVIKMENKTMPTR